MPAPDSVLKLCETFAEHREHFRSGNYNEFQLRKQFLDPLFESLGWDMANSQGLAPQYRDVIHEDAIKIGAHVKAPDYAFTLHGQRKFFLEAKKPSVNIKGDIAPAYQLRRYAWSAKLPLSILSDFEEFAIYETRIKPAPSDPSSKARVFYCTFDQYVEKWDEIAAIFSRDAILKGSFDKYADSAKRKKGTAEVDTAFLEEIERWRDLLARNFALRNPLLNVRDLNFAVQKTIDRLVFLRICEDRGTEDYGRLRSVTNGAQTYTRLLDLFRAADARYNSGLFHFTKEKGQAEQADTLTPNLALDDKTLRDIIANLYYPDSSYEFSVLPADILGSVYERFLGKTIRLTDGHQAKIEEKPEVRKAGGVYYTPSYIVDYIVKNTLGVLLEGSAGVPPASSPHETPDCGQDARAPLSISAAAKLKVVDPACGSGSFLIVAYQFLLDWHRDRYAENPEKWSKGKTATLYQAKGGEWRLTTAEKKRILLNNIHGVDIDAAAVEVTKLSLLLKVLEGETAEIAQRDFLKERERILPDLANNIKCGNSLIGPDFYDQPEMDLLDDEARYRVNVFDWKTAFPEVFKQGGFDCVIGNPPYVLLQDGNRNDDQLRYLNSSYRVASYKLDTYHLFFEQGVTILKECGKLGYITPSNFLTNNGLVALRNFILSDTQPEQILIFTGSVFQAASVDTSIMILGNRKNGASLPFPILQATAGESLGGILKAISQVKPQAVLEDELRLFSGSSSSAAKKIWDKCNACSDLLGTIAHVNFGKQLRDRKKFLDDVIEVASPSKLPSTHTPCYTGKNVNRYSLNWDGLACLDNEIARSGGCWDRSKHEARNKLLTRQIGRTPIFAIDTEGKHCLNTLFMVSLLDTNPLFVLGLLNSKLLGFLWVERFYDQRGTFPKIKGTYLKLLPIKRVLAKPTDVEKHDRMVSLVERMLALVPKRRAEANPQAAAQLDAQISATDRQIDRLVYELYELTDEEIALVEGV
jgi:type I restriction-modification system DNA methylase subunit